MSIIDLAKSLAGVSRPTGFSRSGVGGVTGASDVRHGTAQADSSGGRVSVTLDGSDEAVTLSCDTPVKSGQRVSVVWRGGTYKVVALTQLVEDVGEAASAASGAAQVAQAAQQAAAEAKTVGEQAAADVATLGEQTQESINQVAQIANSASAAASGAQETAQAVASHLWNDASGNLHVSRDERPASGDDTGENVLINALGILLRIADQVLASFTGSGVLLYDGSGNVRLSITQGGVTVMDEAGATIATYAATSTIGDVTDKHVSIGPTGVTVMDGDEVLASFTPSAMIVGATGGLHIATTASGIGIYDGDEELAVFAAESIDMLGGKFSAEVAENGFVRLSALASILLTSNDMTGAVLVASPAAAASMQSVETFGAMQGVAMGAVTNWVGSTTTGGTMEASLTGMPLAEVHFTDGSREYCQRFCPLDGLSTSISRVVSNATSTFVASATVTFSDTSFSVTNNRQVAITPGQVPTLDTADGALTVTRIVKYV